MRFHSATRAALRSHQGTRDFPERITANVASVRLLPQQQQLPRIRKRAMARHKSMAAAESGLAAPSTNQEEQGCDSPDNGGQSELVILDGANICWAYGNALRCIGADMDPEELFPPEEVLAVTEAGATMRGRRPCSKGLLMALEHGPWAAAGKSVEAIIPSSYVEGPLWGLADGFGVPAAVFGGWGFSSGRDSERKRKKAAKAKRKAERKSQRTWRMAQRARKLLKEGGGASGGGIAGREILEALADMDEPAGAMSGDGDDVSEGGARRVDGGEDEGEGLPVLPDDDGETLGDGSSSSCSDAPVGTVICSAAGEPLLQKVSSGDETEDGFSVWRNIPLHEAVRDRRLTMVERSAEAEGGRAADDIAILRRAAETGGLIVSNDLFRDHRGALRRLQRSSASAADGTKARARRRVGYEFVQRCSASSDNGDEGSSDAQAAGDSSGCSLQPFMFIPHDGSTQHQHQQAGKDT